MGGGLADADEAALAARQSFFYALVPGVTEEALVAAVGAPDAEHDGLPAYRLPRGRAVAKVEEGWVKWVNHYDPGDCLLRTIYRAPDAPRPADDDRGLAAREERVAKRDFAGAVDLGRESFQTERHPGAACYLLDGGYLAVEPLMAPLMGASRPFEIARATVYRRPAFEPVVVWRLFDRWDEARPASLTDAEIDRREAALRRHGLAIVGESLAATLREPDGGVGSGVSYVLYYTRAGLVTVLREGDRIGAIWLSQPGAERQTTYEEWLAR